MGDAIPPRIPKEAGFTNGKRRPCRACGGETLPPRRTFCSDECVHAWKLRTSPSYQREHVFRRDGGVCATCGVDTTLQMQVVGAIREPIMRDRPPANLPLDHYVELEREWLRRVGVADAHEESIRQRADTAFRMATFRREESPWTLCVDEHGHDRAEIRRRALVRLLRWSGYGTLLTRTTGWDMDHVIPVVEGGGSCGLDNLRTLCVRCHAEETRALARRRAVARKDGSR